MYTPKKKIFAVLLLIFFLWLLLINSKTISSPLRTRLFDISSPVLKSFQSVFSAAKGLLPFASLREENRLFKDRCNLLTRRIEEIKTIYVENERLRNLLGFRKTLGYTTVPARVIGRDPTNWSNSIIIDKGLEDGVRQNKAVLATKGLVGRVVELGRRSAKILLITDPNSKVGVVIQRNRQGGMLVGRPDGRCKMIYIALDSDVAREDKVITAGLGGIFPKDVLVGEVVEVGKEPGRLYKSAVVKTAADMSMLEEVLCIR